jgi:(heptosyl)LPS beta-1,4-glucosyltransferase
MAQLHLVAVILTKDEAYHIIECVAGLRPWVDAVVVWDSGSADDTQRLARRAGALVVQRPFDNYAGQRQAALNAINAEWILFVDADERVTPAFAHEVQTRVAQNQANGYWIPRRNFVVGHELRGGGYFPDYQLRLIRRSAAHYLSREVHELVEITGDVGYMTTPFIHYNYATWEQFHRKQWAYATYEARMLAEHGISPRPHNFVLQPLREFKRRFVTLRGWQDGWPGLRLAALLAWYYGVIPYWLLLRRAT